MRSSTPTRYPLLMSSATIYRPTPPKPPVTRIVPGADTAWRCWASSVRPAAACTKDELIGGVQGLRLNVTTPISEKRQVFTHQKRCYNTGVHTPRRGVKTVFTRCSHTSYCEYDTCQSPLCLLGSAHGVLRQVYSAARMVCFLRYKPWRSAGRSTCRQRHRLVSRKLILQN